MEKQTYTFDIRKDLSLGNMLAGSYLRIKKTEELPEEQGDKNPYRKIEGTPWSVFTVTKSTMGGFLYDSSKSPAIFRHVITPNGEKLTQAGLLRAAAKNTYGGHSIRKLPQKEGTVFIVQCAGKEATALLSSAEVLRDLEKRAGSKQLAFFPVTKTWFAFAPYREIEKLGTKYVEKLKTKLKKRIKNGEELLTGEMYVKKGKKYIAAGG